MPAWVENEAIWEKAKKAVDPDDCEEYYACVTEVYKNMGGRIKKEKKSSLPAWISTSDGARSVGLE